MSCGITRVVTMQWGQLHVEMIGGTGDLHHGYAHRSAPCLSAEPDYPNAVQMMTNFSAYYAGYAAELADRLDAIPEVAQAMGVDTDVVGDATISPKKTTAPDIDLRGPLPGLV